MLLLLRGCFADATACAADGVACDRAALCSLRKLLCIFIYQRAGDASTLRFGGSLQLESASAYNPNSRPRVVQYGGAYIQVIRSSGAEEHDLRFRWYSEL